MIKSLRENKATSITTARTLDELNLKPRSSFGKLNLLRDYNSYSLKMLVDEGIIKITEDGKLFLLEEKLELSKWGQDYQ